MTVYTLHKSDRNAEAISFVEIRDAETSAPVAKFWGSARWTDVYVWGEVALSKGHTIVDAETGETFAGDLDDLDPTTEAED